MSQWPERYSRQIILDEMGDKGQERLHNGKVLVVGAGGLGTPAMLYLASAGVGVIGVVDDDFVSQHNLNRQVLHWTDDVNQLKVQSVEAKLARINPEVNVQTFIQRLDDGTARDLCQGFDIVLDCTDNLRTRLVINEACLDINIPFVHGGAIRFYGQVMTVLPDKGPCLRCFLPDDAEQCAGSCEREGIMGPVVGTIGVLQALEAIKYLTGVGELLVGRMLCFDGLHGAFDEVPVQRNLGCPVCGGRKSKE